MTKFANKGYQADSCNFIR